MNGDVVKTVTVVELKSVKSIATSFSNLVHPTNFQYVNEKQNAIGAC